MMLPAPEERGACVIRVARGQTLCVPSTALCTTRVVRVHRLRSLSCLRQMHYDQMPNMQASKVRTSSLISGGVALPLNGADDIYDQLCGVLQATMTRNRRTVPQMSSTRAKEARRLRAPSTRTCVLRLLHLGISEGKFDEGAPETTPWSEFLKQYCVLSTAELLFSPDEDIEERIYRLSL